MVANAFGPSSSSSTAPANEPSPPKRAKTEWDSPPLDSIKKEEDVADNIKTDEQATAFLEQMTELLKNASEAPDMISHDIAGALDQLLKGYGGGLDATDPLVGSGLTDPLLGQDGSASAPGDEFVEFFDFSSCAPLEEDDNASKAATPDLVSSSSTNPSPGSGSEPESSQHPHSSSATASSSSTGIKKRRPTQHATVRTLEGN